MSSTYLNAKRDPLLSPTPKALPTSVCLEVPDGINDEVWPLEFNAVGATDAPSCFLQENRARQRTLRPAPAIFLLSGDFMGI